MKAPPLQQSPSNLPRASVRSTSHAASTAHSAVAYPLIHNSPFVTAQLRRFQGAFGNAIQGAAAVVQREDSDSEEEGGRGRRGYVPEVRYSMTNWFRTHHANGDAPNQANAVNLHERRPDAKFNTLTNMNAEDAQRELRRYIEDQGVAEDQESIDFYTRGEYVYVTTEYNVEAGTARVVGAGRARLGLTANWNNGLGCFQLAHLESTAQ